MSTKISPLPQELKKYFTCLLLHKRKSSWDGTYKVDELSGEKTPNIKTLCEVCDKDVE